MKYYMKKIGSQKLESQYPTIADIKSAPISMHQLENNYEGFLSRRLGLSARVRWSGIPSVECRILSLPSWRFRCSLEAVVPGRTVGVVVVLYYGGVWLNISLSWQKMK